MASSCSTWLTAYLISRNILAFLFFWTEVKRKHAGCKDNWMKRSLTHMMLLLVKKKCCWVIQKKSLSKTQLLSKQFLDNQSIISMVSNSCWVMLIFLYVPIIIVWEFLHDFIQFYFLLFQFFRCCILPRLLSVMKLKSCNSIITKLV